MRRLTEWRDATLRRVRERLGVTNGTGETVEGENAPTPLSDNELLDRATDDADKTNRLIEIRKAASERRIEEDAAYSVSAIHRIAVATLCIVAVILAVGFLCYAARGIHISIPRRAWVALSVAGMAALTRVGIALGRFLRGPRGGDRDGEP